MLSPQGTESVVDLVRTETMLRSRIALLLARLVALQSAADPASTESSPLAPCTGDLLGWFVPRIDRLLHALVAVHCDLESAPMTSREMLYRVALGKVECGLVAIASDLNVTNALRTGTQAPSPRTATACRGVLSALATGGALRVPDLPSLASRAGCSKMRQATSEELRRLGAFAETSAREESSDVGCVLAPGARTHEQGRT